MDTNEFARRLALKERQEIVGEIVANFKDADVKTLRKMLKEYQAVMAELKALQ